MDKYWITKDDASVIHLMRVDKRMSKLINHIGDIECNIHSNSYEFIVSEIVGQMLSNKVADLMVSRLIEKCGGNINIESISRLNIEELKGIGISKAKCEYIIAFTEPVRNRTINIEVMQQLSDDEVIKELTKIRGIGKWTAKMYLIFVLQRPDILPTEDVAFLQGYKWLYKTEDVSKKNIERKCKKWSPYSSIASRHLYRAVDMGMVRNPFHLHKEI